MSATIIAGGAGSLLTVRHIRLSGSQRDIGRALAAAAHSAHGDVVAPHGIDRNVERVRRRWFERNYPTLHQRMMGLADYFGIDPEDTAVAIDTLGTHPTSSACSVGFYPGQGTSDGHAILARNMDFPTMTLSEFFGHQPRPGERAAVADPWVVEMYPDDGRASLTICFGDVMGAMDGINDSGLVIALLADSVDPTLDTARKRQVGLTELQLIGYVLDNCATAEEAKDALRLAKHYYLGLPCHFVVADRAGNSFVWEHSPGRNQEMVVTPSLASNGRLVCTNHLLHRWPDATGLSDHQSPAATAAKTFQRWQTLTESMSGDTRVDRQQIDRDFETVRFAGPAPGARTIWHSIYDLDSGTAEVAFCLGDQDGVSQYSSTRTFALLESSTTRQSASCPE